MIFKISWPNWPLVGLVTIAIAAMASPVLAQDPSSVDFPHTDPDPPLSLPEKPSESLFSPDPAFEKSCPFPSADANRERVFQVHTIRAIGNTILGEEIEREFNRYENQKITFATLTCLVEQIIPKIYRDRGYITTGAFSPNQDISEGIVEIEVVEGIIAEIQIEGLNRLQTEYVQSRIERAVTVPFHKPSLETAFRLLLQKPFIEDIELSLNPTEEDGVNNLHLKITEAPAFRSIASFDNYHSPSSGALEAHFLAQYDNLWGLGDRLSAGYGLSEGFDVYSLGYSIPLNPFDGVLSLRYNRSDSRIVEENFRDFGIRGEEELFSIGFRQPLYQKNLYSQQNRKVAIGITEFTLGLSFDLRRSQTFLFDDIPFSFARGAERGESKVSVLRFSQQWSDRTANYGFLLRSQFSLGLDIFDATVNNTGTDGRFFSWQGDFIWQQQLSPQFSLIARLSAQLTPDSLLPIERFSLGGTNNLKGYRPGLLSGDNGIWASLGVPISLSRGTENGQNKEEQIEEYLQIIPSFAIGTVWNNDTPNPNPSTLASLGLGLRWQVVDNLFVHLDYGIPLVALDNRGSSLQDRGLFFALRYEF